MKTKIIFLSIIFILFSNVSFAQKQSAAAFVQSFYTFHRARPQNVDASEVNAHQRWFTSELYDLFQFELKREAEFQKEYPTDKPFFGDGFPFTVLEECYVKGKEIKNTLKIGKTTIKGNKTLVEVSFYQPKVCEGYFIHAYKIELVKKNGGWLINDLIYLDDNSRKEEGRLTEVLKEKNINE